MKTNTKYDLKIQVDNITYVTSNVMRATKKNLLAFHKCLKCVFNADVLEKVNLSTNLYAHFKVYTANNYSKRPDALDITFSYEKVDDTWYKVFNPQFSKHNKYLSIRTSDITYRQKHIFYGAFPYCIHNDPETKLPMITMYF